MKFTNAFSLCTGSDGAIPAGTPGTSTFYTNSQPAIADGCAVYVDTVVPDVGTDLRLEFIRGVNTGTAIPIGVNLLPTGGPVVLSDIAMTSGGLLYGIDLGGFFYDVDPVTGHVTPVNSVSNMTAEPNALVVGPTGTVFANQTFGGGYLDSVDPATGVATLIGTPSAASSGDLAFLTGGTLYMSINDGADALATVNPTNGVTTTVGSIGFTSVYGLVGSFGQLFGFTTAGQLLLINPLTGAGTQIASGGPDVFGAASPPQNA